MGETKAVFIPSGGPLFAGFAHFEEGERLHGLIAVCSSGSESGVSTKSERMVCLSQLKEDGNAGSFSLNLHLSCFKGCRCLLVMDSEERAHVVILAVNCDAHRSILQVVRTTCGPPSQRVSHSQVYRLGRKYIFFNCIFTKLTKIFFNCMLLHFQSLPPLNRESQKIILSAFIITQFSTQKIYKGVTEMQQQQHCCDTKENQHSSSKMHKPSVTASLPSIHQLTAIIVSCARTRTTALAIKAAPRQYKLAGCVWKYSSNTPHKM